MVCGVFGVAVGGEAEEGVDGGQAGVPARHAVVPVDLEVVEEPGDQLGVEVGDVEVAGCLPVWSWAKTSRSLNACR